MGRDLRVDLGLLVPSRLPPVSESVITTTAMTTRIGIASSTECSAGAYPKAMYLPRLGARYASA